MTAFLLELRKSSAYLWLVAFSVTAVAGVLAELQDATYARPAPRLPLMVSDNVTYYQMAQGETAQVKAPFSRRALYPLLVRGFAHVTGLSLRAVFILFALGSLCLLTYLLARILLLFDLSPWITAVFILSPFPLACLENGYMPDLFHTMLITLFFLLLLREKWIAALVILAVAYMARENTLVLCLVFGVMAWLKNLRLIAIGSGCVIAYGTAFGAWALRQGQPNIHHLPDFLYLALKVPHQFLKNVLGFRIWSNTLPFGDPFLKITLPHALQIGEVRVLGFCYPEWDLPLVTLLSLLTLFGAGPLIIWLTRRLELWNEPHPLAMRVAFVYGLIVFFLGTSVGDGVERLIGYGWPLFWIGLPYILGLMKQQHREAVMTPCLVSIWGVAWLPGVMGYSRFTTLPIGLVALFAVVLAYVLTWFQLRRAGGFVEGGWKGMRLRLRE
jgi:hypothetical protein